MVLVCLIQERCRNKDLCMLNREKEVWSNLVQGGFAVEVQLNMELNFETSQEVHKRGEKQIE
jgi:hypothetical protein